MSKGKSTTYRFWKRALAVLMCFLLVASFDLCVLTGTAYEITENSGLSSAPPDNPADETKPARENSETGGRAVEESQQQPAVSGGPETENEDPQAGAPANGSSPAPGDGSAPEGSLLEGSATDGSFLPEDGATRPRKRKIPRTWRWILCPRA